MQLVADEIAITSIVPDAMQNLVRRPNIHYQTVELFHVAAENKLNTHESVDFGIIRELRKAGYKVFSVHENNSGIVDDEVLKIANNLNCLLITEDKDFGELTNRLKLPHKGILLIRLSGLPRKKRIETTVGAIQAHHDEFQLNFTVLDKEG